MVLISRLAILDRGKIGGKKDGKRIYLDSLSTYVNKPVNSKRFYMRHCGVILVFFDYINSIKSRV